VAEIAVEKNPSKDKSSGAGKEVVKKDSRKKSAVPRPNVVENTKSLFRGVFNELKKVHWPNRRETIIYTVVVLVSVVFVGVLIWVFDFILGHIMSMFIK